MMDFLHLKGIVNTNDDPASCALCDTVIIGQNDTVSFCSTCGKQWCESCGEMETSRPCTFCGSSTQDMKILKKRSKEGAPWALVLKGAISMKRGECYDAVRLFRKAAEKSNPLALFYLGTMSTKGEGCFQDLDFARECFEHSASITEGSISCDDSLAKLATLFASRKEWDKAISILKPIVDGGDDYSRKLLGNIYRDLEDYEPLFQMGLVDISRGDAIGVNVHAFTCAKTGRIAQALFWYKICARDGEMRKLNSRDSRDDVLKLCIEIISKEKECCAECGTLLLEDATKTCNSCHAACYCSRVCQKRHWNRKCGHATDCKEAKALRSNENLVIELEMDAADINTQLDLEMDAH